MKNSKKLLIATLMLVFAFVAVVSSTYAWFIGQNQADVTSMDLSVITDGADLQISDNDSDWGYNLDLDAVTGQLTTVTLNDSDKKFKAMEFDTDTDQWVYAATDATPFQPGDESTGAGYLTFDLYFRSSSAVAVKLDVTAATLVVPDVSDDASDLAAVKCVRIAFVDDADSWIIYENSYDANSTYGTGTFFQSASGTPFDAFTTYLEDPDANDIYTFVTDSVSQYTNNNGAVASNKLTLCTLTANVAKHYTVYIWLEGWDGDATNVAQGATFNTYLKFIGE